MDPRREKQFSWSFSRSLNAHRLFFRSLLAVLFKPHLIGPLNSRQKLAISRRRTATQSIKTPTYAKSFFSAISVPIQLTNSPFSSKMYAIYCYIYIYIIQISINLSIIQKFFRFSFQSSRTKRTTMAGRMSCTKTSCAMCRTFATLSSSLLARSKVSLGALLHIQYVYAYDIFFPHTIQVL